MQLKFNFNLNANSQSVKEAQLNNNNMHVPMKDGELASLPSRRLGAYLLRFFSSQILLAEETKRMPLARPIFNLKAIELGAFFAYFHLFRHLN